MKVLITFISEFANRDYIVEMTEEQFNVVKHAHGRWDGIEADVYSVTEYDAVTALNIALTPSNARIGDGECRFVEEFNKRVGVEFKHSMWDYGYVDTDEPVNLKDVDYYIRYGFAG